MIRGDLSTTSVLNALASHVRRVAAPAVGILMLTALPLRLLQIHFLDLLIRLGKEASGFGNLLTATATLAVSAFVLSLYGRAIYLRACRDMPDRWPDLMRIELRAFFSYVYVSFVLELALVLFGATIIAMPLVMILAGVAAAASADAPPVGLVAPLRGLAPYIQRSVVLFGVFLVFVVAFIAVAFNLWFLARVIVWALGAIPAFDIVKWNVIVSGGSLRFAMALMVASATLLEPFWLAAMHVYGDRVRSLQTGDDLRRRFRVLIEERRSVATAAVAVVVFLLAMPVFAQQTMTIGEYVNHLQLMRNALVAEKFAQATTLARDLDAVTDVTWSGGTFKPDSSLVSAVDEAARQSRADLVAIKRLTVAIEALRGTAEEGREVSVDPALLDRIRKSERTGEDWRGGDVMEIPVAKTTVFERIGDYIQRAIDWLAQKVEAIFDWIRKLWPKREQNRDETYFGMPIVVWIVTVLIVATVAFVGAYALRRSRRRQQVPVLGQEILTSSRDEDPLSRESNEWERYAVELAQSGRFREAIRAWYHAVLVTLYRAGVLHYRKGRTNWEYIRALSPELAWRARFIEMTREFEREWYGRLEATPESLDVCAREARGILSALRGSL